MIRYSNLKTEGGAAFDPPGAHENIADFLGEVCATLDKHQVAHLELQPGDATRYCILIAMCDRNAIVIDLTSEAVTTVPHHMFASPEVFDRIGNRWSRHLYAQLMNAIRMPGQQPDSPLYPIWYCWDKAAPQHLDDDDGSAIEQAAPDAAGV